MASARAAFPIFSSAAGFDIISRIIGRQSLRRQFRLNQDASRADSFHGSSVIQLVLVRGARKWNQQRRFSGSGKFGDGGRAGAGNHQIRLRQRSGHVVDKGLNLSRQATFLISVPYFIIVTFAGLVDDSHCGLAPAA